MTEELLPCPFCGGEAEIIGGVTIDNEPCAECGNKSCNYVSSDYMTASQWNTRYQPKYKRVDFEMEYKLSDKKKGYQIGTVGRSLYHESDYQKGWNDYIDDIRSRYGDLCVEVK